MEEKHDGLIKRTLKAIKEAKDGESSHAEIAELKRQLRLATDWHPTKKRKTTEYRSRRRKEQKLSRRINRGTLKGQSLQKGKFFTRQA